MIKKGLAVAVILLFIGVAFAIPINANVSKSSLEPVPDLDCEGELLWTDVEPGSVVTGAIIVENIGEPDSLLDWEVASWPEWGTWTFDPDSGTDLPTGAPLTVVVEVVFPDPEEEEQWDEVLIVNIDDPDDCCVIDVYYHGAVSVVKNIKQKSIDDATPIEFELQRIRDLVQSIDLREIIVNPDAVVDTLEEISNIIEENEDCGCEDDSSDLEWIFPVICTLLVPFWGIAALIVLVSNGMIWQPVEIMAQIGLSLNCYWIQPYFTLGK